MLDEDEAVTLAMLLEELAARQEPGPLRTAALRAATWLRRRVADGRQQGAWLGPADPMARREVGGLRDEAADSRDAQASERDQRADERDERARHRGRVADEADQAASAGEQRILDLLWEAELGGKTAGRPPASADVAGRQGQADQEIADEGRASGGRWHEAIREDLLQAREARLAALQARYTDAEDRRASGQDRHAARADRQDAARDRLSARADRDQTVIEREEAPPFDGD